MVDETTAASHFPGAGPVSPVAPVPPEAETHRRAPDREPTRRSAVTFVPLRAERLERKLALAFGFMSFIPILLVVWALVYRVDLRLAIYPIVVSAFIGYFFIARRMVRSVLAITERVRGLSGSRSLESIETTEQNEIGEIARAFNHITQELERKIRELESSRQTFKNLLGRISTAIVSYEGIDALLTLVVENTAVALEAQMGSLMLVDGERQDLYVQTAWSSHGAASHAGFRVKLGEGMVGWVAKEGRPLRSTGSPALLGWANGRTQEGAILCIPLRLRDCAIGAIAVLREDAARVFTEDEAALITNVGSQMAVAIQNYRLNLDVERTYVETIMALALAVEAKDPYSAGHSKRVGFYAVKIGEELGVSEELLQILNHGGILHDIGKIGIKDEILLKPDTLSAEEFKIMQQHSVIGEAIVKPVRLLHKVVPLVRHHHERYDGTGYPDGLKGEAIPLGARILAVADAYDAMITDRPYRARLSMDEVKAELRRNAGHQHDPLVVDALLLVLSKKAQRFAEVNSPRPIA